MYKDLRAIIEIPSEEIPGGFDATVSTRVSSLSRSHLTLCIQRAMPDNREKTCNLKVGFLANGSYRLTGRKVLTEGPYAISFLRAYVSNIEHRQPSAQRTPLRRSEA